MTLIIIRGLPGSGKTTLARTITPWYCEADMFFTHADGTYQYDKNQLNEAHLYCQDIARQYMKLQFPIIAVSNTFVKRWMIEPYLKMAREYGYQITEITMTGARYESVHDVPEDKIEWMKKEWEA